MHKQTKNQIINIRIIICVHTIFAEINNWFKVCALPGTGLPNNRHRDHCFLLIFNSFSKLF